MTDRTLREVKTGQRFTVGRKTYELLKRNICSAAVREIGGTTTRTFMAKTTDVTEGAETRVAVTVPNINGIIRIATTSIIDTVLG